VESGRRIRVYAAGGVLRVEAFGLAALPSGKVYQAWIIQPSGNQVPKPTSREFLRFVLGGFRLLDGALVTTVAFFVPDANGHATISVPSGQPKGTLLAFTIEPTSGSQSPTTKPFVAAILGL
jgi:hypothetical protein